MDEVNLPLHLQSLIKGLCTSWNTKTLFLYRHICRIPWKLNVGVSMHDRKWQVNSVKMYCLREWDQLPGSHLNDSGFLSWFPQNAGSPLCQAGQHVPMCNSVCSNWAFMYLWEWRQTVSFIVFIRGTYISFADSVFYSLIYEKHICKSYLSQFLIYSFL